jgi:hypothetical protein
VIGLAAARGQKGTTGLSVKQSGSEFCKIERAKGIFWEANLGLHPKTRSCSKLGGWRHLASSSEAALRSVVVMQHVVAQA